MKKLGTKSCIIFLRFEVSNQLSIIGEAVSSLNIHDFPFGELYCNFLYQLQTLYATDRLFHPHRSSLLLFKG